MNIQSQNKNRGFCSESHAVLEISGRDNEDFLQRTSSQNFKNLKDGEIRPGAFLTATAGVIGSFLAVRRGEQILLVVQNSSIQRILQQIEKLHFGEDLKYEVSRSLFATEVLADEEMPNFEGLQYQSPGASIQIGSQEVLDKWKKQLQSLGYQAWGLEEWKRQKTLRFQPLDQMDLSEANIILEAGMEAYVHRNKGCYPGQEVVERIYTYGNIPRKFVQLESSDLMGFGDIFVDGQKSGRVTSMAQDGTRILLNGYLLRGKSDLGRVVELRSENKSGHGKVIQVSPDLNKDAPT